MEGTAERITAYLQTAYGTEPERLWARYPGYMVFRHPLSRKWYAAVMNVLRDRLGLEGEGDAVLLNVKCGPLMTGTLLSQPGFLPAYHMSKTAWVSVLLDGTVPEEQLFPLIEMSWRAAAPKGKRASKPQARAIKKGVSSMELEHIYQTLGVSPAVYAYGEAVLDSLRDRFAAVDRTAEYNQGKVLAAMQKNRVNATHFAATTGYGYDDEGRDNLERVYADVFHTEAALVRPQITCGTHALTVALSANLLPGDELLSPVGAPYDTLEEVIGIRPSRCSLKEYGVTYAQADLKPDGSFDYDAIRSAINSRTKLVTIQRSKGYATRPTFSVAQIGELAAFCKEVKPDVKVMVDNCYGEFVEPLEPSDLGADMVVGSLIKNPGGGLAPIGGYICGTRECVERCAYRLSAPGLGQEVGANLGLMPAFYQGLFLAPTVVAGALKGAIFAANVYEALGFSCVPGAAEERHDIIQAVTLGSREAMTAFCRGIQAAAPVDSYVTPEPWAMPGYDSEVIMAAGAFVQGSSIELSADGPIRPPYAVYFQGGLTWYHAKLGILMSLQKLVDAGLARLPEGGNTL